MKKEQITQSEARAFIRTYLRIRNGAATKVSFTKNGVYYTPADGVEHCLSEKTSPHEVAFVITNRL